MMASGYGLTQDDVDFVFKNKSPEDKVFVVGDAFRLAPGADFLYSADLKWWQFAMNDVKKTKIKNFYAAESQQVEKTFKEVTPIPGIEAPGLCLEPMTVHFGGNSGYQAINLAFHLGATKLVLMGFNMKLGRNSERHAKGVGKRPVNFDTGDYNNWSKRFVALAKDLKNEGVKVLNCTEDTAIKAFEKGTVQQGLAL